MRLILLLLIFISSISCKILAGAYSIDATLPIGAPLAGYNHGDRRVPYWPLPRLLNYTTFMSPSIGVLDPNYAKALYIDNGITQVCFITMDGIGADGSLFEIAYYIAASMGFKVPKENIMLSASHSHSGPGAVSPEFLWAMAPATDLLVPELQRFLATKIATAMVNAQNLAKPAKINIGSTLLIGVTSNRRARISPYVKQDTIDPNLGLIRVDDLSGNPIATLWNFAIHGVCYGSSNMKFSSDISGYANKLIEQNVGGVALFVNGDAGDIDPGPGMCSPQPKFKGSELMADAVAKFRATLTTFDQVDIATNSQIVPFGLTNLNMTLKRFLNCSSGGFLDICTFCMIVQCDINEHLPSSWVETNPRFTAFKFKINNKNSVVFTVPGEALLELGWWLRNYTLAAGFNTTLFAGYSNNHMGYFATPNEYDLGGYESQLTFWGYNTANMIYNAVVSVVSKIKPSP